MRYLKYIGCLFKKKKPCLHEISEIVRYQDKAFVDDRQLNKDVFNGFHSVNRHIRSSSEGFKQIKMFLSLTIFL